MKRKKKVLITGILGQDGANMAEHLLLEHKEDYKVYGMMRRSANPNFKIRTNSKITQALNL